MRGSETARRKSILNISRTGPWAAATENLGIGRVLPVQFQGSHSSVRDEESRYLPRTRFWRGTAVPKVSHGGQTIDKGTDDS